MSVLYAALNIFIVTINLELTEQFAKLKSGQRILIREIVTSAKLHWKQKKDSYTAKNIHNVLKSKWCIFIPIYIYVDLDLKDIYNFDWCWASLKKRQYIHLW